MNRTAMRHLLVVVVVSLVVLQSASTLADEEPRSSVTVEKAPPPAPPPPAPKPAAAAPAAPAPAVAPVEEAKPARKKGTRKGCRELRLQQVTTARFPGVPVTGFSRAVGGSDELNFGGVVGMGFCVTDLVEIGGHVGVSVIRLQDDTGFGVPFNFFLKLNFLPPTSRFNPFLEWQVGGYAASGAIAADLAIRFGVEFFIRPDWALFIAPGFEALVGSGFLAFAKLGWGISAYF